MLGLHAATEQPAGHCMSSNAQHSVPTVVGKAVGAAVGSMLGWEDGLAVGSIVGDVVGSPLGTIVGTAVGAPLGGLVDGGPSHVGVPQISDLRRL